jgi:hypothetical protein
MYFSFLKIENGRMSLDTDAELHSRAITAIGDSLHSNNPSSLSRRATVPPARILRQFLNHEEQARVVREIQNAHYSNHSTAQNDWPALDLEDLSTSRSSIKLPTGVTGCGGDITAHWPYCTAVTRRVFSMLAMEWSSSSAYSATDRQIWQCLSQPDTPLTGLALLYGPQASMSPHYDSPTQPGQRSEWLVMITVGLNVNFRLQEQVHQLHSGDVVVLDSMRVLHGVESIAATGQDQNEALGLPPACRLGVLLWQGKSPVTVSDPEEMDVADFSGMDALFQESDSPEDDARN